MSIHDFEPIITVTTSPFADGPLALYQSPDSKRIHLDLGDEIITTSDTDLAPLAKAILNAVEPGALVENQKAPEPTYKPGDWVKVAANSPYNSSFRGQTLRLADDQSLYSADGFAVLLVGAEGYSGAVSKRWITPASAPEPAIVEQGYDVPALVASVADLEDRVAALESKPEPEPTLWGYKVGDLVKYTQAGTLPGEMRRVSAIHKGDGIIVLANPQTGKTVGSASAAYEITRA